MSNYLKVICFSILIAILAALPAAAERPAGNRFLYLDQPEAYHPGLAFPKLTAPMWIGEEGVEAAVILSIDDMTDPERWDRYLAPILARLKVVEGGKSPLSIMTCRVPPEHPTLQRWLADGVSIEVHTTSHPCPLLQGGDFEKAARDYHACVEAMHRIPGNHPVAFRMPCCDSRNTVSPRFFSDIFSRAAPGGQFLTIDSSILVLLTGKDPALPRELVLDGKGKDLFRSYIPFPNFANIIEDYPYPYAAHRLIWEFPCIIPSDWEAQNIHGPYSEKTVADLKRALDAAVIKQGVFTLIFHPHGWIRAEQVVELIDHAAARHPGKVRFLSFREAQRRIDRNLLGGATLRSSNGGDGGVRTVDLDGDGHLDIVIGRNDRKECRVWDPKTAAFRSLPFPAALIDDDGRPRGVKFVAIRSGGQASVLACDPEAAGVWHFEEGGWSARIPLEEVFEGGAPEWFAVEGGVDRGVRCPDIDGDGFSDVIVNNDVENRVYLWDRERSRWRPAAFALPGKSLIVDADGRDRGLRFEDIDGDGVMEVVLSNESECFIRAFENRARGWARVLLEKTAGEPGALPPIVRDGRLEGAWFHAGALYIQNERTASLPDLVEKRDLRALE